MEESESNQMGWHSHRTGCCYASRERISSLNLQRKMLKATPTWESTQNPGKLSPHSTLGRTELKGRGGWETLELKPSMLSTGLRMGSRCPGLLTLRLARKGNTFLSQLLGLHSQQLPESRGGRCLTIWAAHCQEKLPGCGEGQGRRAPLTQHGSWHARGMDGSAPSLSCHQEVTLQPGTAY